MNEEFLCPNCGEDAEFIAGVKAWVDLKITGWSEDYGWEFDTSDPEKVYDEGGLEPVNFCCENCGEFCEEDELVSYD